MDGTILAIVGAVLAAGLTGIGSTIGVTTASQAAAGVISEDPEKFGKTMLLQLFPSSQALYGFVIAFLVVLPIITDGVAYTLDQGLMLMLYCLPIAIVGMVTSIFQGKVAVATINMVGKKPELAGKAATMIIFSELFALIALIVSVLGVL
ncbi:MAG: V-type ATP synthase subunit K [Firmicutes bacterium]|nr:V-type ATP synthase subunit K [Bacillota bacterium]